MCAWKNFTCFSETKRRGREYTGATEPWGHSCWDDNGYQFWAVGEMMFLCDDVRPLQPWIGCLGYAGKLDMLPLRRGPFVYPGMSVPGATEHHVPRAPHRRR